MVKKLIFCTIGIAGLLLLCYLFQPGKTGKGVDATRRYVLQNNWLNLPPGVKLGNPTALDFDTSQNLVVLHRAGRKWPLVGSIPTETINSNTILIIDRNTGRLINSWGSGLFVMPHGLKVDNKNNIWVTDVGLHQVFKFSCEGKLLLQLGEPAIPGNDRLHFNKPTDIAIGKDGSFYVSDGYGNSRVIKFSATGSYLFEWGRKGDKQSEFDIPHGISLDSSGRVYVADRENHRVQIFDPAGNFIKQLSDESFGTVCAVEVSGSKVFAVDDVTFLKLKHRGSDILVVDTSGQVQTRFGRSGSYQGAVSWYHDLALDKEENIFVGDILGNTIQKFRKVATP